jgi:hypothetical protein
VRFEIYMDDETREMTVIQIHPLLLTTPSPVQWSTMRRGGD